MVHQGFVRSKSLRSRRTFRSRFYLLKLQTRPQNCRQPSSQDCPSLHGQAHIVQLVQERQAAPQTTRFDVRRHQLRLQRNTVDPASDQPTIMHAVSKDRRLIAVYSAGRQKGWRCQVYCGPPRVTRSEQASAMYCGSRKFEEEVNDWYLLSMCVIR